MNIKLISSPRWATDIVATSIGTWLRQSGERLAACSDSARADAECILSGILARDRAFLYTWPERMLTDAQCRAAEQALVRRIRGEPIAHIRGEQEFWSLSLYADASTLIPRADTEIVVETVLELARGKNCRLLDLGTGTGAIALAVASERPDFAISAVDKSPAAVRLAKKNCQRCQLDNVCVSQSDWFANVRGRYHVVVSNPPYIDKDDEHLRRGDLLFEPHSALVAGENGLADIRRIAEGAKQFLLPCGYLILEHGWRQKRAVQALLQRNHYFNIETRSDYGGNDRVTFGQWR